MTVFFFFVHLSHLEFIIEVSHGDLLNPRSGLLQSCK
jgi:hypothetical protein